jgi:hypothetical protein
MYKLAKPIRCPNCGEIVQVDTSMILTSYPPQYKWECPKCGRTGTVGSKDDIITFENQIGRATSGYIRKVDEADPGVGITTTNADDLTTINATTAIYSTNTRCIICGEEFRFDGEHRICPECREAIIKLRGTAESTANTMPADNKSTANAIPVNKSTETAHKTTECNIPAPQFIQQGWQCPKCGAVLAPHQSFCPFCSKKESDWITTVGTGTQPFYGEWTNRGNLTPPTGQYTNPNPSITISSGDILKVADSCTHTSASPCNNIKATL